MLQQSRYITVVDDHALLSETLRKVDCTLDEIVEGVEVALGMFPDGLDIELILLPDRKAVSNAYEYRYGGKVNYKAFISLSSMKIWVSVKDINKRVLAHEIAHAIVETYFTERPPYKMHELMAQYAERHVK